MKNRTILKSENDLLLENKNFRNNQNYIISLADKQLLSTKVEYKSKLKSGTIYYPYLNNEESSVIGNNGSYRLLKIGEIGIINNIRPKQVLLNIFKGLKTIIGFLISVVKKLFNLFMKFKHKGKIISIFTLILGYLLYDYIEVYTGEIMRYNNVAFYEALKILFIPSLSEILEMIKEFFGGLLSFVSMFFGFYLYIKIKGFYYRWRIQGKYLFFVDNPDKRKVFVYRYY